MTYCPAILLIALISGIHSLVLIEPQEEYLEVTSGANFALKCTGDNRLRWDYPPSIPAGRKTSSKTVNEYRTPDGKYAADLLIKKAHYMDTGLYQCSDTTEEQNIYLFVRDSSQLLAIENIHDHIVINKQQYENFFIPCRPTSTDVNITLFRDSEPVEVPFDNKKGFWIRDPVLSDSGYYTCNATRKSQTQLADLVIKINPKSETAAKPIISVKDYEGGHIIVGMDITMMCYVIVSPGVRVTLDWETPDHVNLTKLVSSDLFTEKVLVRGIEKRRSSKNLEIKNVAIEDAGDYICRYSDHSRNTDEEKYQLEVFSIDMKYLNLTMEGTSEIQVRVTQREAQWIVHIDAYPVPEIQWYGPDNEPLPRTDKYTMIVDAKKTMITVHNLSIEDSGIYTLHASNAVKNVTSAVTLLVEDKPRVYFEPVAKRYFDINKEQLIECIIMAYPVPTVKWSFTECTDHISFCAPGKELPSSPMEPNALENVGHVKWRSQIKWYARESGVIECSAENYLGLGISKLDFKVTDVDHGFDIWGPKHRVLSSDTIFIGCGASIYEFEPEFEWIYKSVNGSKSEILTNSSRKGVSITTNKTSFSYQTHLYLSGVSVANSGIFTCRVKSFINKEYQEKEFKLLVQGRMDPVFTNFTNLDNSIMNLQVGRPVTFNCSVLGLPEPEVNWFKDGKPLVFKNNRVYLKNKNHTLHIEYTEYEDGGVYSCKAFNGPGNSIFAEKTLKLKGPVLPSKALWWVFIVLVILTIALAIGLIAFCRKYRNEQRKRKELISVGLYNFSEGQIESIDPNVDIGVQAELLPYDKKWEFPRERLKLGKQLGSGAFGVVLKAEAMGLYEEGVLATVAVKMAKQSSLVTHVKALATELKIMAHLGQHLNVVNLLGACTGNVHKRELLVIVEYCKYGNLHKYLLHHRNSFINQIDPDTGIVNFPDKKDSGEKELTYIKSNNYQQNSVGMSDYSNGQSVVTDMTSLSTPVGEDGYLMNRDVIANYQGDYKTNSVRPISTQDLLSWSFQVSKGMEYLASRKVLHGDLAARNVLLAEGNVVKISDFGLAKSLYYKENYQKMKRDIPLPLKWLSIEAIRDGIFSTQSDIWSFGVLLWEMFSLAVTPYPGLYGEEFYQKLLTGYRMEKPKYATEDVYNIMLECWKDEPMLRPSFTELSDRLGCMLGESVKEHYLQLNSPYMENNANISSENDPLSKLMEPSYENCLQSGMPDCTADGYVCMKPPKNDALNDMELRPMITPGANSFLNPGYEVMTNFADHNYSNILENCIQGESQTVEES